ncbi:MAG: hypothetical protein ACOVP4_09285 [Bacteriovoracaceae bacterium]
MFVFRLLLLIQFFLVTACVPEAYLVVEQDKISEEEEVLAPYDLASNFNIGGSGYRGCYVDPLSRGLSESISFSFSQDGENGFFLDFSHLGWTNGSCSFSGQFPTTIKSEYYKIIKSELIGRIDDKDHVKLTLIAMNYDDDLGTWVENSGPYEIKEVLNEPSLFYFLVPEKYENRFEVELFLDVR